MLEVVPDDAATALVREAMALLILLPFPARVLVEEGVVKGCAGNDAGTADVAEVGERLVGEIVLTELVPDTKCIVCSGLCRDGAAVTGV